MSLCVSFPGQGGSLIPESLDTGRSNLMKTQLVLVPTPGPGLALTLGLAPGPASSGPALHLSSRLLCESCDVLGINLKLQPDVER